MSDLGSRPLSRRCSPPSATGRICAACGNPLAVALAALVAREGQLLVAFIDRCPGQRFLVSRLR